MNGKLKKENNLGVIMNKEHLEIERLAKALDHRGYSKQADYARSLTLIKAATAGDDPTIVQLPLFKAMVLKVKSSALAMMAEPPTSIAGGINFFEGLDATKAALYFDSMIRSYEHYINKDRKNKSTTWSAKNNAERRDFFSLSLQALSTVSPLEPLSHEKVNTTTENALRPAPPAAASSVSQRLPDFASYSIGTYSWKKNHEFFWFMAETYAEAEYDSWISAHMEQWEEEKEGGSDFEAAEGKYSWVSNTVRSFTKTVGSISKKVEVYHWDSKATNTVDTMNNAFKTDMASNKTTYNTAHSDGKMIKKIEQSVKTGSLDPRWEELYGTDPVKVTRASSNTSGLVKIARPCSDGHTQEQGGKWYYCDKATKKMKAATPNTEAGAKQQAKGDPPPAACEKGKVWQEGSDWYYCNRYKRKKKASSEARAKALGAASLKPKPAQSGSSAGGKYKTITTKDEQTSEIPMDKFLKTPADGLAFRHWAHDKSGKSQDDLNAMIKKHRLRGNFDKNPPKRYHLNKFVGAVWREIGHEWIIKNPNLSGYKSPVQEGDDKVAETSDALFTAWMLSPNPLLKKKHEFTSKLPGGHAAHFAIKTEQGIAPAFKVEDGKERKATTNLILSGKGKPGLDVYYKRALKAFEEDKKTAAAVIAKLERKTSWDQLEAASQPKESGQQGKTQTITLNDFYLLNLKDGKTGNEEDQAPPLGTLIVNKRDPSDIRYVGTGRDGRKRMFELASRVMGKGGIRGQSWLSEEERAGLLKLIPGMLHESTKDLWDKIYNWMEEQDDTFGVDEDDLKALQSAQTAYRDQMDKLRPELKPVTR